MCTRQRDVLKVYSRARGSGSEREKERGNVGTEGGCEVATGLWRGGGAMVAKWGYDYGAES